MPVVNSTKTETHSEGTLESDFFGGAGGLNIISMRFTHVVVCIRSVFILIPVCHSATRLFHNLCIHSLVDRHLKCVQFGAVVNKAIVPIRPF